MLLLLKQKYISQLRSVVQQVEETPLQERQAPVGILTTEHRDTWGPVSCV